MRANPNGRAILGFISYGYALELLRLDRVEEFLLFIYAHRYHDHTPGTWTAGEVAGITGGTATFCIPAQQTVPLLVRWMLALDEERLYLAKGLPREWVGSGKVNAMIELARDGAPREVHLKMRLPVGSALQSATVNGRAATIGGAHADTVVIGTSGARRFSVVGVYV